MLNMIDESEEEEQESKFSFLGYNNDGSVYSNIIRK